MRRGDTVVYTQPHYLWLVMANKWPSKYIPRREFTGEVLVSNNGVDGRGPVAVHWRDGTRTTHLAENLEVVT